MSGKATISASCSHCGSKQFKIPSNPQPTDTITCAGCGRKGRYGDLRAALAEKGKKAIEKAVIDTFEKAGFKVTKR
jgi:hypothetical protein